MKNRFVFFDSTPADHRYFSHHLSNFGAELVFYKEPISEQNIQLAENANVISVHVASKVSAAVMHALPHLQFIAARTTGYDNIDVETAKKANITVSNVPRYGENTVAEYTFMLLLALSRKVFPSVEQNKSGKIDHSVLTGFDLSGKTLGVIGTGSIGQHVIRIANGFSMPVIAYDPFPNNNLENDYNLRYVNLHELFASADIITLHAPYTGENKHLINTQAFASMKKGVILINTSRGELVDTKALVAVLASGKLGGAGLDVVEGENLLLLDEESELLHNKTLRGFDYAVEQMVLEKMPNVIITPHNAFNSKEAIERINTTTLENISNFFKQMPTNTV